MRQEAGLQQTGQTICYSEGYAACCGMVFDGNRLCVIVDSANFSGIVADAWCEWTLL